MPAARIRGWLDDGSYCCVREGGFEPPRPCGHWHLKPARLPFRHPRMVLEGPVDESNRADGCRIPPAGRSWMPAEWRPDTIAGTPADDCVDGMGKVDRWPGCIQRFEQRLEGAVTGAFARAFRSAVQPVEIAAALQREVDNSAHILSRERMLVPNDFTVELSPSDYEPPLAVQRNPVHRAVPARRGARQGAAVHPRRSAQHRLRRERGAQHRPVPGAQPHQRRRSRRRRVSG